MKELSDVLLDSKDAFQCHNKETNQAAAELKEKLTKEKKSADKIKKMVETFILQFLFGITLWLISMKQKLFIPTWWVLYNCALSFHLQWQRLGMDSQW